MAYRGGRVLNSYFIGELTTSATYFGNVAGVCAPNIYQLGSYTANKTEYFYFENNCYAPNNFGVFGGVGTQESGYSPAEDKGATAESIEKIKNMTNYKAIMSKWEK